MSREWRPGGSVTLDVAAPPDAVYAVIADVERIGERSPECRSATWLPGLPPAGTEVTHSYEITLMPSRVFKAIYGVWLPQHRDMRPQMLESLQNLKRSLE